MRLRRLGEYSKFVLLTVAIIVSCTFGFGGTTFATTSTSSNYQVDQTQFGSGSTSQSCSSQYCAQTSIGDTAAGSTISTGTTAKFGSVTNSDPELAVIIVPGISNLGVLSASTTATKTTTIQVLNYLSSGYVLQIVGEAPKYGSHTLDTPTTPTASTAGTEQFAMNAVANTSPTVGTDPAQVPSGDTSFGVVNSNYNTPNLFMYSSGDVVGHSTKASGRTDYTISMIVNISTSTPAGHYSGDFSAVVIPTY